MIGSLGSIAFRLNHQFLTIIFRCVIYSDFSFEPLTDPGSGYPEEIIFQYFKLPFELSLISVCEITFEV